MSRNTNWWSSMKRNCPLKCCNIYRNKPELDSLFNKFVPPQVFSHEYCEIFKNTNLEEIWKRLLRNVVFNSNEEQLCYMLQLITLYIYLYHFGITIFVFYPEAVVRRCSFETCF